MLLVVARVEPRRADHEPRSSVVEVRTITGTRRVPSSTSSTVRQAVSVPKRSEKLAAHSIGSCGDPLTTRLGQLSSSSSCSRRSRA